MPSSVPWDEPRGKTCHPLHLTLLPYSTALPLGCPGSSGHPQAHLGGFLFLLREGWCGLLDGGYGRAMGLPARSSQGSFTLLDAEASLP